MNSNSKNESRSTFRLYGANWRYFCQRKTLHFSTECSRWETLWRFIRKLSPFHHRFIPLIRLSQASGIWRMKGDCKRGLEDWITTGGSEYSATYVHRIKKSSRRFRFPKTITSSTVAIPSPVLEPINLELPSKVTV